MKEQVHYAGGYKYQLTRPYSITVPVVGFHFNETYFALNENGFLYIRAGYAWDGASGPTIDTKASMRASLVHDVLYQAMRLGLLPLELRPLVDQIFRDICIEDGMWKWRANLWYRAVRLFARDAALPENRRREMVAP